VVGITKVGGGTVAKGIVVGGRVVGTVTGRVVVVVLDATELGVTIGTELVERATGLFVAAVTPPMTRRTATAAAAATM
jgi:hypothetical protein